jgi:2-methylisocitrate lyase-like PEP mutase family enzyme
MLLLLPIILLLEFLISVDFALALAGTTNKPSAAKRLQSLYNDKSSKESNNAAAAAIILPGVHDALSAKVFANNGAKALFLSGFGVSACRLGQPDVGILTLTEMEETLRSVVQAVNGDVPVIVDGDTGYGGAVNVRRTIRSFAAAGAAAVTIEDQVFPKTCTYAAGHGVRVVSREESCARIQAALAARNEALRMDGNEILVVARTDCRASLGLQEAIDRCKMYEALGADICYAENLQSREEYIELRSQLLPTTRTILAQVQTGDKEQILYAAQEVGELNYDLALFGVTALQTYVKSLETCAARMLLSPPPPTPGSSTCCSGLILENTVDDSNLDHHLFVSFDVLKGIIGFAESESFQAKSDC